MATLGFGIVGCGMIADFHAKAIGEVPGTKLKAVFDTFPASAERLAAKYGVDPHTNLDEMLARKDIHIVNICTPSGAHLEPAVAAAKAGKHVVVEKPLEINLKRCDAIIKACRDNKVKLSAIFPSRFMGVNAELRRAIDKGRFGRLTLADMTVKWWRTQQYYDGGGWRGTWKLDGGGSLMNQAIHNVDLLQYMMGPIVEVAAFSGLLAHQRIEVEDTAVGCVRFANGGLGTITATTSVFPGLLKTIAVHGDKGSVVIEQDHLLEWSFDKELPTDAKIKEQFSKATGATGGASDPSAISHAGHALQLRDMVNAIKKDKAPLVDGPEGRKSVEIIMAIYQSQVTGKIVKLPLAKDPSKLPQFAQKSTS